MDVDGKVMAGTRIEKVMANIRQRITSRSLVPGARLPSVRALAKTMQLSTSTIVEAYDRLVADGTISSRPGSGFCCRSACATLACRYRTAARQGGGPFMGFAAGAG